MVEVEADTWDFMACEKVKVYGLYPIMRGELDAEDNALFCVFSRTEETTFPTYV